MKTYDLVVIGGGSAGYNAARVAADLGRRVAVVDVARQLGGLCILRGCMPSKTLIYSAEVLHLARNAGRLGLRIPRAVADMAAVHARKRRIIGEFARCRVHELTSGRFDLVRGRARFVDSHTIELSGGIRLRGKTFLVATGSRTCLPPVPGLAVAGAWTSDDVLDLDFIPRSVIVLGGGIVACELAQFLGRIGARVTLVQRSGQILSEHSARAAAVVSRAFTDEGIEVFTGTKIRQISRTRGGAEVVFQTSGRIVRRRAAHVFNALGRAPDTAGLNLAAAGVRVRQDGGIIVNRWQQSNVAHIYAAGDCCGPHEIVHLAVQQGELAARHSAGRRRLMPVDPALLLNVVFTDPSLATIGRTEKQLKAAGQSYVTASYPFDDHGKSILMEALYGHVKVIAEPVRGRLLGAEIVGRDAHELIHCFSAPLAMRATVFDLLRAPWYHPTLAEIITYPLEEIAASLRRSARPTRFS